MSDALDNVRDECANGRQSPALVAVLQELDARTRALETVAVKAADTAKGGK